MKNNKNKALIIFFCIGLLLTIVGLFGIKDLDSLYEIKEKTYIAKASISNIVIEHDLYDLKIVESDTDKIKITYSDSSKKTLEIDEFGDTLNIKERNKRRVISFINVDGVFLNPETIIEIPRNSKIRYSIQSDDSNIELRSIKSDSIEIESDNGDIILSRVEVSNANLISDNGDITFNDLNILKDLFIEIDNGDITGSLIGSANDYVFFIHEDNGSVNIPTFNGRGNKVIRIESDNGNIDIDTLN